MSYLLGSAPFNFTRGIRTSFIMCMKLLLYTLAWRKKEKENFLY